MSSTSQTVTSSADPASASDVRQPGTHLTQRKPRWWSPFRVSHGLMRPTLFMLLGAAIVMFVPHRFQNGAAITGGLSPRLSVARPPGVHFLSESASIFDSFPRDSLVQVCAHVIDIEVGEQTVMVDRKTFTIQQMDEALRIVAALETSAATPKREPARRKRLPAPPPVVDGVAIDRQP